MEVVINYWAVFGAAVVAMILGALWYGPVFGTQWMTMTGLTPEGMKSMKMLPGMAMGLGFITTLLMAYVLSHVIVFASAYLRMTGPMSGMSSGFWMWLGFAVPLTAGAFLWEGKPIKLWLLNAAYYLVSLPIMGAILGYFP